MISEYIEIDITLCNIYSICLLPHISSNLLKLPPFWANQLESLTHAVVIMHTLYWILIIYLTLYTKQKSGSKHWFPSQHHWFWGLTYTKSTCSKAFRSEVHQASPTLRRPCTPRCGWYCCVRRHGRIPTIFNAVVLWSCEQLPSLKWTVRTWKWDGWNMYSFPFGIDGPCSGRNC